MEEVRFRVWDVKEKKMYYPDQLTFGEYDEKWCIISSWVGNKRVQSHSDYLIPLQHIGHRDKNGKRIYKDDIVKYDKVIGVVKWDDSEQGGGGFYIDTFDWHSESYFDVCWKERWGALIVIGNIYENSELLEKEEE